jgi:nuclear transcription factor Y gamma
MVQAAAQAQAVVAAAKNRGGGLVPMNAAQIHALSQIQAQAIVNARPQTALVGSGRGGGEKPTPQQMQNQVQLQAQALVHAHTQAQISAGIYKGGDAAAAGGAAKQKHAAPPQAPPASLTVPAPLSNPMAQLQSPAQLANQMKRKHPGGLTAPAPAVAAVLPSAPPQSYAVAPVSSMASAAPPPSAGASIVPPPSNPNPGGIAGTEDDGLGGVIMPANSAEFLAKLDECLNEFWAGQLREMRALGTDKIQTEQDFKNHNDLPLARIKRIMKSDEDVRMISAEAPVLFAKACEMFILEMTLRSWNYSENNKRKTLQKEDVKEAIQRTDIFDFLVDVID